jgi:regulator of protease activity HflC (stomatin/prohibitin superfamily)
MVIAAFQFNPMRPQKRSPAFWSPPGYACVRRLHRIPDPIPLAELGCAIRTARTPVSQKKLSAPGTRQERQEMFGFHIIKQYERAVVFHLGRVNEDDARGPGLIFLIPLVNRVRRVSLRIVTLPIQSQGIITRDNVSIDVSAVAYYRVEDPVRSVLAIENVSAAINQIAQTTLRAVVGRHTLDETLSETDKINQNIREILDVQTEEWGVKVTVVELKDIQLPDSMQRAMARQAEAEREKRAKIIAAQGEALAAGELGRASDEMMAHPLALQLRNLQTMVEIGVDKNSTIMFPAPLMSTIEEIGTFLSREAAAAVPGLSGTPDTPTPVVGEPRPDRRHAARQ